MYTRHLTPAQKARETKLRNLCWDIAEAIAANPTPANVLEVFKAKPHKTDAQKYLLADAFMELDEKPGRFGHDYWKWHSPLRNVRNTPDMGRELFALWA